MFVKLYCISNGGIILFVLEVAEQASLLMLVSTSYRLDYCQRINPFMYMQGDSINHKARAFGLAGPLELGIKMWVKLVGLLAVQVVCLRGDQTDRGIVQPLLILVGILLN